MSKKILILGAGESGVGAAKLALTLGYTPFVSDAGEGDGKLLAELTQAGISFEVGGHNMDTWEVLNSSSTVIKSPGISDSVEIIKSIKLTGAEVISEIEFASRHASGKVIAITGTNGKTTTTAIIHSMLKDAGIEAACVGNIGVSWARDLSERTTPAEITVLEASSFQLDGITSFRPDIAVLLNITPDHLDRYENKLENYAASKWRITANQTTEDYLIYNFGDKSINKLLNTTGTKAKLLPVTSDKIISETNLGAGLAPSKNEFLIHTYNQNPPNHPWVPRSTPWLQHS